ncbi:hypothetical protein COB11_04295 [Candidatus Aerophobetes bacterium]|uniref:Metallo-beta-lactamase domain-containing protein n=1 Tax=Aerophobetes bacterium TaxID=2030807 RepID=A0A2A4YGW9_UNCAE|nr:MAG: hypothetical protein COB11_04295 [Candidatus Aerophobetes bacterium]
MSISNVFSNLELCFLEKNSPWNISIYPDKKLERATFCERAYYYVCSFFSSVHENHLKTVCKDLLKKVSSFDLLQEKQKILVEKVSACVYRTNSSWLFGIETELQNPKETEIHLTATQREDLIAPVRENGRFVNFPGEAIFSQFLETLRLLVPGMFSKGTNLEDVNSLRKDWEPIAHSEHLEITWLGHASMLLQLASFNLLIDPAFDSVGMLFKRYTKPGIALEDLPLLDFVGVSHNHDDHCQERAVSFLSDMQPCAMVPKHFDTFFKEKGYARVHDTSWWETITLKKDEKEVTITSIPAQHGSMRGVTDINTSHWQGFVVQDGNSTIYVAGDTALQEGLFEQVKDVFGKIDLAVLPIAPERELLMHLDCEQSLKAFEILDAELMLPYHFGAYRQAKEVLEDPYTRLDELLKQEKYKHLSEKVILPKIGERFNLENISQTSQVEVSA